MNKRTEEVLERIKESKKKKAAGNIIAEKEEDIDNLKRELKRDGLYSEQMEEFLENYMRYYNK